MVLAAFDRMDQSRKRGMAVGFTLAVCVLLAAMLSFGMARIFGRSKHFYHTITPGNMEGGTRELVDGDEYLQVFTVPFDKLKSIEIAFSSLGHDLGPGKVVVSLLHEGENIQTWKIPIASIENYKNITLNLKKIYSCSPGDAFDVTVRTKNVVEGRSVALMRSLTKIYEGGVCCFNGKDMGGDLYITLRGSYPARMAVLFPVMLFLSLILALILTRGVFFCYFTAAGKLDELVILLVVSACCVLFSQHADQLNSSLGGIYFLRALRHGKILDFYSYQREISQFDMIGNYNIVVYILMAVIHLPYYILMKLKVIRLDPHTIVLYYNVFLGLILFVCGKLFEKVLRGYGADHRQAFFGRILFCLSPVILFGTVGIVQQDLLYILLLLIGILLHQKGHRDAAFLVMSVSVALKSIPLFILVPFILLSEKNILKDIRFVFELLLVSLITGMIYGSDAGYQSADHAMYYGNLFDSRITMSHWEVSLFLLAWFLFCCWCFYKKKMGGWKDLFVASLGGYSIFAMLCGWNPQYLAGYGVVLAAFGIMTSDKNRYFAVMAVLAACLISVSCVMWEGNVDNVMCAHGVFYPLTDPEKNALAMSFLGLVREFIHLPVEYVRIALFSVLEAAFAFLLLRGVYEMKGHTYTAKMRQDKVYSILVYLPVVPLILYLVLGYGLMFAQ